MTKESGQSELDTRKFYEKLSNISALDQYWTSGFGRNIHVARCKVFADLLEIRSRNKSELPLLDLGCGDGTVSIWLAKRSDAIIVGCDISRSRVARAVAEAKRQEI